MLTELPEQVERVAADIRLNANLHRTCTESWIRKASFCIEARGENF